MSELSKVHVPPDGPMIATIAGTHGAGKTTLAASYPKPIFIQAEKGGLTSVPIEVRPDAFEPIDGDSKKLFKQLNELANEKHPYETCVIDTVSAVEDIFVEDVKDFKENKKKKIKSLNNCCGGFGNGQQAVAGEHLRIIRAAEYLAEFRGMHVLFLAHIDTKIVDPPDVESYTQYSLQMNKYSVAVYCNYSYIVAQCKNETYVKPNRAEDKPGKAKSTGNRIVSCLGGDLSNVNKNRYRLTKDIPFILGENPFSFLPIFNKVQ